MMAELTPPRWTGPRLTDNYIILQKKNKKKNCELLNLFILIVYSFLIGLQLRREIISEKSLVQ